MRRTLIVNVSLFIHFSRHVSSYTCVHFFHCNFTAKIFRKTKLQEGKSGKICQICYSKTSCYGNALIKKDNINTKNVPLKIHKILDLWQFLLTPPLPSPSPPPSLPSPPPLPSTARVWIGITVRISELVVIFNTCNKCERELNECHSVYFCLKGWSGSYTSDYDNMHKFSCNIDFLHLSLTIHCLHSSLLRINKLYVLYPFSFSWSLDISISFSCSLYCKSFNLIGSPLFYIH